MLNRTPQPVSRTENWSGERTVAFSMKNGKNCSRGHCTASQVAGGNYETWRNTVWETSIKFVVLSYDLRPLPIQPLTNC